MRQHKLETLVWLARLKSFRAVAEKLNTTQAAISQRVASVENQLGVVLFERRKRQCKLTAEGREIIPYAERILELTGEMLERVANADAFRGVVRLGVVDTIVHVWLTTLLEQLQAQHPHVTVELRVDTSTVLREAVQSGSLDMAFLVGPLADADMSARYLCTYEFGWVASPALGLEGRRVPLEEISRRPIITFPRSSRPYALVKEQMKAAQPAGLADQCLGLGDRLGQSRGQCRRHRLSADGLRSGGTRSRAPASGRYRCRLRQSSILRLFPRRASAHAYRVNR